MNDDDPAPEPYLEGAIADTLAPLRALFTPEELEALRRTLRDDVNDDPELVKLHRAARPRVPPTRTREESIEPRASDSRARKAGAAGAVVPFRRKGGAA